MAFCYFLNNIKDNSSSVTLAVTLKICSGAHEVDLRIKIFIKHGIATDDSYGKYLQNDGYCNAYNKSVVIGA